MKPPSHASPPSRPSTIGVGTGANARLADPGAARAFSFAAEELGYASVWTFDSPAGERWNDPFAGRDVEQVLATLETFVASTSVIAVGAGLLRTPWPVSSAVTERLVAAHTRSDGRVVLARPHSAVLDTPGVGRTLQIWAPGDRTPAPWANGWMFERWEPWTSDAERCVGADAVVVRLPVHDDVDRVASEIRSLRTVGVSEIVLDVIPDKGIDHALSLYSSIAEAVEDAPSRRTA